MELISQCGYCWVIAFQFDSRHAGYGDRMGQNLAQVITTHQAIITIDITTYEVEDAVMDGEWDMVKQKL